MQHHPGSWYLPWGVPLQKMLAVPYQHPASTAAALTASTQMPQYAAPSVSPNSAANGALTCQVLPTHPHQSHQHQHQHQHQHSPNSAVAAAAAVAAAMQAAQTATNNYQHQAAAAAAAGLHANAGTSTPQGVQPLGAAASNPYSCSPNTAAVAPTASMHPHPHHHHQHQHQHQHQHLSNGNATPHTAMMTGNPAHLQNAQLQGSHAQALHAQAAAAAAAAMFTPLSLRTFLSAAAAGNHLAGLAAGQPQPLTPCGPPSMHQQNPVSAVTAAAFQQMTCVPTTAAQQLQQQHQQHQQLQSQHQHQHQHPHSHSHSLHQANQSHHQAMSNALNLNVGVVAMRGPHAVLNGLNAAAAANVMTVPIKKLMSPCDNEKLKLPEKRKAEDSEQAKDLKKAKLETKALKAKRPGFTDERYHETSYYIENGLRKVYPYYFTFTTFTKGRWVGEKILDVFAREFRAHPAEEYERCIKAGTLTVNYEKVPTDYRLKHNDLLANIVHRHEVPVTSQPITIVHMDDDIVVVNKPASIPVHPCGRYRHNTVVFILAKEYNLKNLRTIHRLDRLTSGLLLFGRSPKKARQMEHQIRNRQVQKEYICRVEGNFPEGIIECTEPIEVVSYKIGVCKVSLKGKDCTTTFQKIAHNGKTSVVLCKPRTGRMHQIRVHLQYLGFPVVNDPLYNHEVFGPLKGRGGDIGGKTDEELVRDLINIHNAENWLGIDSDSEMSLFKTIKGDCDSESMSLGGGPKGHLLSDDDSETVSREASPCSESPKTAVPAPSFVENESPNESNSSSQTITENTPSMTESNVGSPPKAMSRTTTVANGTNFPAALISRVNPFVKVTVATQTGHESPDMAFNAEKMTADAHCYECKVRYRDPKPKDLVMYLHAWKYKGPGWEYETELPNWASTDWAEPESD